MRKLTLFPLKCHFSDPKRGQRCALPSLKKKYPFSSFFFFFSFFVQASVPSRLVSALPLPPPQGNKCIAHYDICSPNTTRLPRYAHVCFSSPEPKAHRWAYSVGRHPSSVVRRPFVNIFKYLFRSHWASWNQILCGGSMGRVNESSFKRSWSHDQDATIPIYGKNLNKSSPEPKGRWPRNLVCSIQIPPSDDPVLTLTYFMAMSNSVPYAFVWENGKTMDFTETIDVYALKLATDDQRYKKFPLTSELCPLEAVCPCPGAIYMY